MFKSIFAVLLMLGLLLLSGCNQDSVTPSEVSLEADGPTYLLVEDSDPLSLESDHAFMMDGAGPIIFQVLDLSEEQIAQIREIVSSYRGQFGRCQERWQSGQSWEDIRAAREAARDSMFAEILTVLTPEQRAIIEEIQNQLDQGIYPEILVEKRVEFFTELLSLTADQQNIFSAMFAQFGQDMLEARDNAANRRELHETLRALFEELDTQIAAVLNADQLEVYNAWKAERERHRPHHRPHGG